MNTGIYTIESPTNKVYVGQSIDIKARRYHYSKLQCQDQPRIYNSLKKHGWENHQFTIIMPLKDGISQEILNHYEQFFIDFYRDQGIELLNIKEGGHCGRHSEESKAKLRGRKLTEEHKLKIGLAQKGKKKSPEHIAKMSAAGKGRKASEEVKAKMRGRKASAETKQKMSIASRGKPKSEEHRRHLKGCQKGRKISDESKAKMSASAKARKREPVSEATKLKMSKLLKGRVFSEETKKKMGAWQIGRKLTDEHIQNVILGRKNSLKVKEANVRLSERMKGNTYGVGRKLTEEHKQKISKGVSIGQKRRWDRQRNKI